MVNSVIVCVCVFICSGLKGLSELEKQMAKPCWLCFRERGLSSVRHELCIVH